MAPMCNAYSLTPSRNELIGLANDLARQLGLVLDVTGLPEDLQPRYRYSPRQMAPILRKEDGGKLVCELALWGLLTKGSKPGFAPTNARDDKLTTGWPWKMISRAQRCLVSADGFFEPEKEAGAKGIVPWSYYAMGNRQPFFMGRLWNAAAHPKTSETVTTYAVVTTSANDAIRIHNRMPVILEADAFAIWLSPGGCPPICSSPFPASA